MARIRITEDNLLTSEEFRRRLEEIEEHGSLLDDILDLRLELFAFEQQYSMSSDVFYARFMRGEMGDDRPFIQWAIQYDLFLNTKAKIESQLSATRGEYDAQKVLAPVA